jgi:hypothetical protein
LQHWKTRFSTCISIKEEVKCHNAGGIQEDVRKRQAKECYAKKRNHLKNKKLDSLMQVSSVHEHSRGKALLQKSTKPLFYTGTKMENTTRLHKCIGDGHMLCAINDLKDIATVTV